MDGLTDELVGWLVGWLICVFIFNCFVFQALTAGDSLNSKPSEQLVLTWPGSVAPQVRRIPSASSSALRVAWTTPHLTDGVKVKHFKVSHLACRWVCGDSIDLGNNAHVGIELFEFLFNTKMFLFRMSAISKEKLWVCFSCTCVCLCCCTCLHVSMCATFHLFVLQATLSS